MVGVGKQYGHVCDGCGYPPFGVLNIHRNYTEWSKEVTPMPRRGDRGRRGALGGHGRIREGQGRKET